MNDNRIRFTFKRSGQSNIHLVGIVDEFWIRIIQPDQPEKKSWAIDFAYDKQLGFAYSEFFNEYPEGTIKSKPIVIGLMESPNMKGKRVWYPTLYDLSVSLNDHPCAIHNGCHVIPDIPREVWDREWNAFLSS